MKKGKFKKRMELAEITEEAYDRIWDPKPHQNLHRYRRQPTAWITEYIKDLKEAKAICDS